MSKINVYSEIYYPVNDAHSKKLLAEYRKLAESSPDVVFGGRLGCYQYWDMDKAVRAALDCASDLLRRQEKGAMQ